MYFVLKQLPYKYLILNFFINCFICVTFNVSTKFCCEIELFL